ncbi:DUF3037 domain-containing protein [Nocardioides daejeonensis]|uniref:DUF3037 domain-containing protein n=1 Tax=Nocardioides daejeonensis TaxID=1046556 RepID=UPI000D74B547|nr:DUF3037 domain-containing protein [Nocardioides daejeonensis]
MSTPAPYEYVVIRCVPRVHREEFVNLGVVVHCQSAGFLDVAWRCEDARLLALDPALDLEQVCDGMAYIEAVCRGTARAGAAAGAPLGTRFGFIKAPRSTVLQPGPVHGGVTSDPADTLLRLRELLVD